MADPKKQPGEGDYDAARRYQKRVEEHLEEHGTDPSAPVDSPESDLSEEEKGKARARDDRVGSNDKR
jgi:hypothetical protein